MTSRIEEQMKLSQYEATVVNFITKERGTFLALTEDTAFLTALKTVLNKYLSLVSTEVLTSTQEVGHILKTLKIEEAAGSRPVLFMERSMGSQDLTFMVRQFKAVYPKLLIIILTTDAGRQRIMYLHEVGADNFITKPVSPKTIIEKVAFTIKPQTKLGQAIDIAKGLLQEGETGKARNAALKILEMKPDSAAGFMVLGDVEQAQGNMEAAREAYLKASANAEMYMEPLRKLALLAEAMNQPEEALGYLEKLDKLSPLNSERKVNMGEIHLGLGHEDEAQTLFESAVDQITKDALDQLGAIANRIASIYAEKDPARSEMFLKRALNIKHNYLGLEDIKLFNKLGISLRQQGKWAEAVEEYKKALAISPDDENLYYNLGMAYAEGKQYRDARLSVEKALSLNPDLPRLSSGIAYNLGVIFLQSSVREKARDCLETALELEPGMTNAKLALARLE